MCLDPISFYVLMILFAIYFIQFSNCFELAALVMLVSLPIEVSPRHMIAHFFGFEGQDRTSLWFCRTRVQCVTVVSMVMPGACAVNDYCVLPFSA